MKILIASDGSKFSKNAVKKCAELVPDIVDAEIKVISVVEPFTPAGPEAFGVVVDYYVQAEKTASENAREIVSAAEKEIKEAYGREDLDVTTTVIKDRFPKHAIVDEATEWGADLIVVGSHGYGFWDRMLLGSVSNAIVHHAPCSVMVIRMNEG